MVKHHACPRTEYNKKVLCSQPADVSSKWSSEQERGTNMDLYKKADFTVCVRLIIAHLQLLDSSGS